MKTILLVVNVMLSLLSGCDVSQNTTAEPALTKGNLLTGTYWKLVELNGKALPAADVSNRKEIYMMLNESDSQVVGNGACNDFAGKFTYTTNDSGLVFSQMLRTKMACPGLDLENELFQVFENTDRYYLVNNELHLIRAQLPPMAKFISIAGKTAN